jgi:hypothetical protein
MGLSGDLCNRPQKKEEGDNEDQAAQGSSVSDIPQGTSVNDIQ